MKFLRCALTFSLLSLLSSARLEAARKPPVAAKTHPSAVRLEKAISSILPKKGTLQVGIVAELLQTGETIFEDNADELLVPASVNKVFTSYIALKRLKPSHTFTTTVSHSGSIRNGVLDGDLYIKGGGDPSLVSERMWMLVNDVIRSGIKQVKGNVVGDSTYFDTERTPETRPKYLKDQAYNAPIGALSFNFNTTTVFVRPGDTIGGPPKVFIDPDNSYIEIVNQATTGKAGSNNSLTANRIEYVKGDMGDTVLLRGSIPMDGSEQHFYRNIVNPTLYATHMFKTFLEQRGVTVAGKIVEGVTPGSAKTILEFESLPLWQVIWGMNKFSNNFVADQILKEVGARLWGAPGTLQKGLTTLEESLEDLGIKRKTYEIKDGAGLTRSTRVTARQILTVLKAAHREFSVMPEFIASLGISGEDGTLKKRLSHTESWVRAKTGTLDGVSSLAGFTQTSDREVLAFVIVLNDLKGRYGKMSGWVDKIATAFSKFSRQ